MSHSGRPKVDQMPCTSITLLPRYKMIREFDRICFQVSSVKRSASNLRVEVFRSSWFSEKICFRRSRQPCVSDFEWTQHEQLNIHESSWIINRQDTITIYLASIYHQSINSEQNHRESGTLSWTMVPMFLRPLNDSDSLRPSSFILVLARVLGFVRSRRSSTKLALKSKDVGIEPLKWRS